MFRQSLAGLIALAATAFLAPGAAGQQIVASDSVRLRPGDAVRLVVKNEPQLAGNFPVEESGYAMLPLLGPIAVAGRPFHEVSADIRAGFARELTQPVMLITPVVRIAVLGEVRVPGLFPIDPTFSLRDVLARAGGLLPTANTKKIMLVRGDQTFRTRLDRPIELTTLRLRPGDQIIVGRRSWFSENLPIFVGAAASVAAAAVTSAIVRKN